MPMSRPTTRRSHRKVSGYIAAVLVDDNEPVKAGQVLARIDDRDFKVALQQAEAEVEAARAKIANKQAAIVAQQSVIEAARATVAPTRPTRPSPSRTTSATPSWRRRATAASRMRRRPPRRSPRRVRPSRGTPRALATAAKQLDVMKAELAQAEAALARTPGGSAAGRAQPLLHDPRCAGRCAWSATARSRVGQYVQAGTQLMSVVPDGRPTSSPTTRRRSSPTCSAGQPVEIEWTRIPDTCLPGPGRQPLAGERPGIRAAAA